MTDDAQNEHRNGIRPPESPQHLPDPVEAANQIAASSMEYYTKVVYPAGEHGYAPPQPDCHYGDQPYKDLLDNEPPDFEGVEFVKVDRFSPDDCSQGACLRCTTKSGSIYTLRVIRFDVNTQDIIFTGERVSKRSGIKYLVGRVKLPARGHTLDFAEVAVSKDWMRLAGATYIDPTDLDFLKAQKVSQFLPVFRDMVEQGLNPFTASIAGTAEPAVTELQVSSSSPLATLEWGIE